MNYIISESKLNKFVYMFLEGIIQSIRIEDLYGERRYFDQKGNPIFKLHVRSFLTGLKKNKKLEIHYDIIDSIQKNFGLNHSDSVKIVANWFNENIESISSDEIENAEVSIFS
jgi:hypothetical protein